MPRKLRDLAVKIGTYTDRQGKEKGRWQNIGALMRGDDGGEFVILHRWFNPAGVPNPDNRDSVLVSAFKPQERQEHQNQPQPEPQSGGDPNDDVPFRHFWSP